MTPSIEGPGLVVAMYGDHCPVQAEGTVDGVPFYFRSRGRRWTMNVGERTLCHPEWRYAEAYGDVPYAAGWISGDEAIGFIKKAADLYRSRPAATHGSTVMVTRRGEVSRGRDGHLSSPAEPVRHERGRP